jgi:hypothetical protein
MIDIIEIPLSKNRITIIDAEDWEKVSKYKWAAKEGPYTCYAAAARHGLLMHRLIMATPRGFLTDHIDRDGLNNRRSNLRIATQSQNLVNSKTSGKLLRGVEKSGRGFAARITVKGKKLYLGTFNTELEAHEAHINKSIEIYGEFVPQELIDNLAKLKGNIV